MQPRAADPEEQAARPTGGGGGGSAATVKISGGRGKVTGAALISCGSMSVNPAAENHVSDVGGNTTAPPSIFQFRSGARRRKACCAVGRRSRTAKRSRFGPVSTVLETTLGHLCQKQNL